MEKISLVTGASSGLGRAIALLLVNKGHKVYVTARRKKELEKLKKESEKLGNGQMVIFSGDLAKKDFRKKLINKIIREEGKIDYLINNAGFGRAIKFEDQKVADIENMFEVNVVAYQHLTNLVLRDMKKKDSGKLIHVGSVVAFTPLPYFTTYNSTKSAIYGFNRSLRYELKNSKVTSTIVLPARMKTGFADVAFDCHEENGKKVCVDNFNNAAGSAEAVAKVIVKKIDSGKEVITPTFKAKIWYLMRYFGFIVDFVMKNILGPKELKKLKKINIRESYKK